MAAHAPATTAAPVERTARSAVRVLIIGSLLAKAGGFSWDFLAYYVGDGTGHGTTAAGAALTALASLPPLGIALALEAGGRPLVAALLAASAALAIAACLPLARSLRTRTARPYTWS